jgi:hypothetical protein
MAATLLTKDDLHKFTRAHRGKKTSVNPLASQFMMQEGGIK